jgi:hypothetical protein
MMDDLSSPSPRVCAKTAMMRTSFEFFPGFTHEKRQGLAGLNLDKSNDGELYPTVWYTVCFVRLYLGLAILVTVPL